MAKPILQIPPDVGTYCRAFAKALSSSHGFLDKRIKQYAEWMDGEPDYSVEFSPDEIGTTRDNLAKAAEFMNWLADHGEHGKPVERVEGSE